MDTTTDFEQLLDYRRRVAGMYARVREDRNLAERCVTFREERDALFRDHPQSPFSPEAMAGFSGLSYYPYDPALRFVRPVEYAEPETIEVSLRDDGPTALQRFGRVRFEVDGEEVSLSLFWVSGYGGGVLLPFRDATGGGETYGGGRYVLDTIKHADLGSGEPGSGSGLVIDFNYAYNPSCAYDDRWHCPLAPIENHLSVRIPAGEKAYESQEGT